MLYAFINWYTQRFRFPFRGWKYMRGLLRATGIEHRSFLKKLHNGLRIRVSPQGHIQQQIFWYGFYEKKYVLAWERLLAKDSIAVDIGANIGYYSLIAAKKAVDGKVFSFEPQPAVFEQLLFNMQLNRLKNIFPQQLGVGDHSGAADFFIADEMNDGMSGLSRSENGVATETIQLVTLDEWAHDQSVQIDFVKMDIEGAEYNALLGMSHILQAHRPVVFIEISGELLARFGRTTGDVYALFHSFNYSAYRINTGQRFEKLNEELEDELVVFSPVEKSALLSV